MIEVGKTGTEEAAAAATAMAAQVSAAKAFHHPRDPITIIRRTLFLSRPDDRRKVPDIVEIQGGRRVARWSAFLALL